MNCLDVEMGSVRNNNVIGADSAIKSGESIPNNRCPTMSIEKSVWERTAKGLVIVIC